MTWIATPGLPGCGDNDVNFPSGPRAAKGANVPYNANCGLTVSSRLHRALGQQGARVLRQERRRQVLTPVPSGLVTVKRGAKP